MSISTSGPGQPQLHHREQAVAAGDEAGLRPVAFEQRQGVVDARGALVLDRRGYLHGLPLPSCLPGGTVAPPAAPVNTADKRSLIVPS